MRSCRNLSKRTNCSIARTRENPIIRRMPQSFWLSCRRRHCWSGSSAARTLNIPAVGAPTFIKVSRRSLKHAPPAIVLRSTPMSTPPHDMRGVRYGDRQCRDKTTILRCMRSPSVPPNERLRSIQSEDSDRCPHGGSPNVDAKDLPVQPYSEVLSLASNIVVRS